MIQDSEQTSGAHVRCSAVVRLWYVHLTPKKKRDDKQMQSDLAMLARGPGETDMEKILWVAKAMCGIEDHRDEKWATRRQKPLAFRSRRDAVIEAEKHENEYWHASVREMRVIEPNDQAQRPPPETPGRLQQSRANYLNRPTARRGGGSLQRSG